MSADIARLLDAMQARCDAATDGPWRAALLGGVVYEDGSSSRRAGVYPGRESGPPPVFVTNGIDRRDAEFIAASRADLPRLIAAVRAVLETTPPHGAARFGKDFEAGVAKGLQLARAAVTAALKEDDDD